MFVLLGTSLVRADEQSDAAYLQVGTKRASRIVDELDRPTSHLVVHEVEGRFYEL
jgi:hypothetical protein